jgi:hypothetical protein
VSLRSKFRIVMSITISAYKQYSVRLYLQLFIEWLMSYLRNLCSLAHSGVQQILCCAFVLFFYRLVYPMLLDCQFLIALSIFSNVYFLWICIAKSLVFCVVLLGSLFVFLSLYFL